MDEADVSVELNITDKMRIMRRIMADIEDLPLAEQRGVMAMASLALNKLGAFAALRHVFNVVGRVEAPADRADIVAGVVAVVGIDTSGQP